MPACVGRVQADGLEAIGFQTEAKQTSLTAALFGSRPTGRQNLGPDGSAADQALNQAPHYVMT